MLKHSSVLQMKVETLQNLLHNWPTDSINAIKIKLHLKKQQQLQGLISLNPEPPPIVEDNDDSLFLVEDEQVPSSSSPANKISSIKEVSNQLIHEDNIGFEKSVILKEFFASNISEIAKKHSTQITIIPNKIKIAATSVQGMEETVDQLGALLGTIESHRVERCGEAIYASHSLKAALRKVRITMVKILESYHYWFLNEESQVSRKDIGNTIQAVFLKSYHGLFSLGEVIPEESSIFDKLPESSKKEKGVWHSFNVYRRLSTQLRVLLFKHKLKDSLNHFQKDDKCIQLSEDEKSLVIHSEVVEQLTMQRAKIEEQFRHYSCVYFSFQSPDRLIYILEALEALKSTDFFFVCNNSVKQLQEKTSGCLPTFAQEYREKIFSQDFLYKQIAVIGVIYQSRKLNEEEIKEHCLTKIVAQIYCLYKEFKISTPIEFWQAPKVVQNKFLYERDGSTQTFIPKIKSLRNFQQILAKYVLAQPKVQPQNSPVNISMDESSINPSRFLEDSSLQMDNTIIDRAPNPLAKKMKKKQPDGPLLLEFEKQIKAKKQAELAAYCLFFPQADRRKKYSGEVQEVTREGLPQKGKNSIERKMNEFTGTCQIYKGHFHKVYKVKIPQQLFAPLEQKMNQENINYPEGWVTLFVKSNPTYIKPYADVPLPVYLLNAACHGDGFLINAPKSMVSVTDKGGLLISSQSYEVICVIRQIKIE